MATSSVASKLLRFTNVPLHTLLRSGTTATASAATQLITFETSKPNTQNPDKFKPINHTEHLIFQSNLQNPFGFTATIDQSKARILSRKRDDTETENEDYDFGSDDDDDDDDDDDEDGEFISDDDEFGDASADEIEEECMERGRRRK